MQLDKLQPIKSLYTVMKERTNNAVVDISIMQHLREELPLYM